MSRSPCETWDIQGFTSRNGYQFPLLNAISSS